MLRTSRRRCGHHEYFAADHGGSVSQKLNMQGKKMKKRKAEKFTSWGIK